MTLSLTNISKRFDAVVALDAVNLVVTPGEVHALLGENGAGKSTLMHIAYGMLQPDSGTIQIRADRNSDPVVRAFRSPRAARDAGIGMVHQHFTSIPALTVAENIALTAGWKESGAAANRRAEEVVQRLGLPLRVHDHVESLSVQLRQRLEIVKALAADASILLLDEPTAVLAPREVDELLTFLRAFAAGGGAIVLITHKLDEVFRVADRVTVLRRGQVTLERALAGETPQSLSRAMIGADLPRAVREPAHRGEVLVGAHNLGLRRRDARDDQLEIAGAEFELRSGEIAGVAAIEGNGQRALLRAIAGVGDVATATGTLDVAGPVVFIPEDRIGEGLIPEFTLTENLLLGISGTMNWWLDWKALRARTAELIRAHDVRAPGPDAAAATLSGGNQQKFILARALEGDPRVVVAENPTRGLDVQATQVIHQRLRHAAHLGAVVVIHSSDLDEVLALADRLFVVAEGDVRELASDTPRDLVGDAMLALGPAA